MIGDWRGRRLFGANKGMLSDSAPQLSPGDNGAAAAAEGKKKNIICDEQTYAATPAYFCGLCGSVCGSVREDHSARLTLSLCLS